MPEIDEKASLATNRYENEAIDTEEAFSPWDFDKIFDYIGHIGKQQKLYSLIIYTGAFCAGANGLAPTFLNYITLNDDKKPVFADNSTHCDNYTKYMDVDTGKPLNPEDDGGFTKFAENEYFEETVTMKFNLICDREALSELEKSVYFAGQLVSSILAGLIGDNYGRKLPVLLSSILVSIATLVTAFTESYTIYMICRFFISFCIIAGLNCYVMLMELVGPKVREPMGLAVQSAFAFGYIALSFICMGLTHYTQLIYILTLINVLPALVYFVVPESSRYLLSRNKIKEAKEILVNLGKKNGASESQINELKKHVDEYSVQSVQNTTKTNDEDSEDRIYSTLDLFRHSKYLTLSTLQLCFLWGTVSLVFFGISLNINKMPGNLYVTNTVSGLAEFIAALTLAPFLVTRYPFKQTLGYTYLAGSAFFLATYLALIYQTDRDAWILVTACCFFAKFFFSATFAIIYNYTAALFPTAIRGNGMSLSSASARFGSVVAPLLMILAIWIKDTFGCQEVIMLLYMIIGILSFIVCQGLVEVFGKPMIMSFDDFDRTARDQRQNNRLCGF